MAEVGNHHANARTTFTDLERLIGFFGPDKRLDEITNDDVAKLVTWRRSHAIKGKKQDKDGQPIKLISPATVNRSTIILLRAIFSRAKGHWDRAFPREPKWGKHLLKEPKERVRYLDQPEAEALDASVREDYALWFEFARLTGMRRNETLIRWKNVNIFAKRITTTGKGGKEVTTPITPAVQTILDQCRDGNGRPHHEEFVFTYVCKRPMKGQTRGTRYPITAEGAKTEWRRLRRRAGVENFRFHDIRHDVATKLLRNTGNLKLVQRALNHSDIKTTVKYAHVLDDEVAAALYEISSPTKIPTTDMKKAG